jgi:hypothetical protein
MLSPGSKKKLCKPKHEVYNFNPTKLCVCLNSDKTISPTMSDSPRCLSDSRLAKSEETDAEKANPVKRKKGTLVDFKKTQAFKMPPVPTMGKFKYDPWTEHPLMKYFGQKQKKKQDDEVIIRHGKKIKSVVADSVYKKKEADRAANKGDETSAQQNVESFLTQEDFVEYLRDSVRSAPVVPMHKKWRHKVASVRYSCTEIYSGKSKKELNS